jgi:hypothetical protein
MRNAIAGSLALVLIVQSGHAQLLQKKALSLEAARKMVAAAEAEADRNHWRGVVAVVDDGGWTILLERMDHAAMTASVELAAGKARSAALFKKPTQGVGGGNQPRSLRGGNRSRLHRDARWASGRSRRRGDRRHRCELCDAREDEQVAKAGLAALGE